MKLLFFIVLTTLPLKHLKTIDNTTIDLDTIYTKKPLYVSFWAMWCTQCIKELDRLNTLKDSLNIYIIAINEDGKRKKGRTKSFSKGHKWDFPIIIDERQEIMRKFGVLALPSSFLYDTKGNILKKFVGFSPKDEKILTEILDSLKENVDTLPPSTD